MEVPVLGLEAPVLDLEAPVLGLEASTLDTQAAIRLDSVRPECLQREGAPR
jgi:hypothetical protein